MIGCEHGISAKKFTNDSRAGVDLPCAAMLPPSFIDYALSKNLADGVAIVGCREGTCQYRLGPQWTEDRLENRRDPHLRSRVPRERLCRVWAAPIEWTRTDRELSEFQERLSYPASSEDLSSDEQTEAKVKA